MDYELINEINDNDQKAVDELMSEINIEPDQYTGALLDWMSSNLNRYAIADELYQEDYKHGSLFDLMQVAQSTEIEEVKMSILNDLRGMLEEIEDNQSS